MAEKFMGKYRNSSARLQNWDYAWNAPYFITICTKNREYYFGEIIDGKMQLSNIGTIANIMWYEIKNHTNTAELDEFVVMPNHIHGILILNNDYQNEMDGKNNNENSNDIGDCNGDVGTRHALPLQSPTSSSPPLTIGQQRFQNQGKNTVSSIIGSYKSAVTKHARRLGYTFAWQSRFHDHIIRDDESFQRIKKYIENNPLNWGKDKFKNEQ
jgi:REP element-mobilizing transposase RayT